MVSLQMMEGTPWNFQHQETAVKTDCQDNLQMENRWVVDSCGGFIHNQYIYIYLFTVKLLYSHEPIPATGDI